MTTVTYTTADGVNSASTHVREPDPLVVVEAGKNFETDDPDVIRVLDAWSAVRRVVVDPKSKKD